MLALRAFRVRNLRIALLSESKAFGGAEHYLLLLAEGVRALGHEAVFFLPGDADWRPRVEEGTWAVCECSGDPSAGFLKRMSALRRALKRIAPDILHINLPSTYAASFSAGAMVGRLQGCRVVTTEHLSMIGRSRKRAPIKAFFTSFVDEIIAVSDATRRGLVETHGIGERKITVVLNGVNLKELDSVSRDQARSRLGTEPGAVVLGCAGELIKRKGHSYLIDAFAEIKKDHEGRLQLIVVGDGVERGELERQVKSEGIEDSVVFAGNVTGAGPLLKAFDIFVMPSLMEAMPFALLEAMAGGVPCVATDVWGIPEVVRDGETGLLVPAGDTPALKRAILRLLADPGLRGRMGDASRAAAEARFSLESMVSNTVAVYERVTGGARRRASNQ